MTHQEALQLVIAHSGAAFREANKALVAIQVGSLIAEQRVRHAIEIALKDATATFSPADKYALGGMLAKLTPESTRTVDLRIRLTPEEKAALNERASAARQTLSAYVRQQLELED